MYDILILEGEKYLAANSTPRPCQGQIPDLLVPAGMRLIILRTAHYVSCFALIHASFSQCMICKYKDTLYFGTKSAVC